MAGVRNRTKVADYLNTSQTATEEYALMGVGFKTLDENPSAQTKGKKYVCDVSTTNSVASYDASFPWELDQIREDTAVDFICNIGEKRLTGGEAETDYVRVDLNKPVSGNNSEYEARKFRVAVAVESFPNDDGEMTGSGNLLGIGDPIFGKFNTQTKTFTAETED